ncbi:Nuclear transport factor 2 (NTF2) family protein [Euphorbia peplus]|nr:Nuclear transport factor 2 (NTF2) family protein [Euphorbia peplus]
MTTMNLPNNSEQVQEQMKKEEKRECSTEELSAKQRFSETTDFIIPHILNLYGSCATASDFEIYAPDASFEDPLMSAHGVQQIKSAFYSISKVFKESKIVEYSVEENVLDSGKREILIDNKQHYKMLGKDIDMKSLIKLYVENGKVVRHEDWWDKEPIANSETSKIAALGKLKEIFRRGSMLATHAMMGFGKDPNSKN